MYDEIYPEVKYGEENSRIDFLLKSEGLPDCYVEVKSITFVKGSLGMFPDAVTTRGQKHVRELLAMKNKDIARLFSLLDYMMASIVLKSLSL